jgi:hypothetical protein
MERKNILIAVLAVAMITMACGIQINLPNRVVKTGPTQTQDIKIALPDNQDTNLRLKFGAGELKINPGAQGYLVDGTATYNVNDFAPVIQDLGRSFVLRTGDFEINGIPNFNEDVINEWDIRIASVPIVFDIEAGAFEGEYELGGLALKDLFIRDGASNVKLAFSYPNLVEMQTFRYETGASKVSITGVANANFQLFSFRSGAGDYVLDFSGDLKRDAVVRIQSGVSRIRLVVPAGTSARVLFSGGLADIDTRGEWTGDGNRFENPGSGPLLTIEVDMAAGSLRLEN